MGEGTGLIYLFLTHFLLFNNRKVGMTLKDATSLVQKSRPEAEPIPSFMSQLEKYENKCRQLGVICDDAQDKKRTAPHDEERTVKRRLGPAMGPGPAPVVGPAVGPLSQSNITVEPKPAIGPAMGPAVQAASVVGPSSGPSTKERSSV